MLDLKVINKLFVAYSRENVKSKVYNIRITLYDVLQLVSEYQDV